MKLPTFWPSVLKPGWPILKAASACVLFWIGRPSWPRYTVSALPEDMVKQILHHVEAAPEATSNTFLKSRILRIHQHFNADNIQHADEEGANERPQAQPAASPHDGVLPSWHGGNFPWGKLSVPRLLLQRLTATSASSPPLSVVATISSYATLLA